ncbi:hypothetical protein O181_009578 [Austropuccinia psidii MF-1]|uniref:Vps53 N-terminal domain-containing protein n=1 Tax=Austropuccinia psidii MF-1 TaxID=1389203 RepID=A0A9Q3BRC0_9BASI|nr:hypothetical protein [Austropuccinia psidii MF-1]
MVEEPSLNPLDSEEFDTEDAINELCPDESSLANLPLLKILLRQRILECNQQIALMKSQLESRPGGGDGKGVADLRLEGIQEGIGALLTTFSTIRSSSAEARSVVESITKEIRTLDLAKANIESAVVGLKRFGMLVSAFDQLTRVAKSRKYQETASSLQTVQQLSAHLKPLSVSVPRVAVLFKALQETQGLLRRTIMEEFSQAFETKTASESKAQLGDACLVMETLGDDARVSLVEWYSNFQLREYRRIFSGPSSEAGQLDNISRRYAWFRRILKSYEEDPSGGGRIFPESWQVGASLCGQFGEVTREDLKSVLARCRSKLQVDMLLKALQTTTAFELEMSQKFGMPYEDIAARSKSTQVGSATSIRTAFESYLNIFVDAQDNALSEMFNNFRSKLPKPATFSDVALDDRPAAIIPSSMELFYFYRSTLDQCASLSNKAPFLDLCQVYKKWLKVYSEEILTTSLSATMNYMTTIGGVSTERPSGEFAPSSTDGSRLIRTSVLLCACAVLNTADYCAETSQQLQNKLQEKIHPELKVKVTLENEQDLFRSNISSAISSLLKELETSCDSAFMSMLRAPWKDSEFVSAESAYIHNVISMVTIITDLVKKHAEQKKYVRSFCDKAVGFLANRFSSSIVRCRPIPPIGAEQMILDLQVLKNHLLVLPQIDPDTSAPSSYTRYVTKSIGKLDTLLKVIMTPDDPAEDFVKHYLLLIPCQSFSDFQKILDLKGVRRQDQNTLHDIFLALTSTQPDLADSSFLSSIDMNPDAPSIANPVSLLQLTGLSRDPTFVGLAEAGRNTAGNHPASNSIDHPDGGGSRAFNDFKRFGQKLGMGLRFTRETKAE